MPFFPVLLVDVQGTFRLLTDERYRADLYRSTAKLFVSGNQYFKLIGRSVISSWVTAVGDFIRFYSVTSS